MNAYEQPASHTPPALTLAPQPPVGADLAANDRATLETMVRMSLRMRLRGIDLEMTTELAGRELDLVAMLTQDGPTSVKSLVADLGLPRSTMTAIVDRLQERGLVIRQPNPDDRRSVMLEATPAAHAALRRYEEGMLGFLEHIKKSLSVDEVAEFDRLIGKLEKGL